MSEQTVNETSTEIHGQHLQVRLNGRSLFNLHRPLDDRYHLDAAVLQRLRQALYHRRP
jgi:TrbB protein